ncbi:YitT family protein [Bacillus carboniphilus]|uniref:YitT family protein n=1 Tax=Bacillus carboniphilus TaxID=86663 RepID=A0ABN0WE35_9BACI
MKTTSSSWVGRFVIFIVGLLVMAFGFVLLIISDLGATPWDVLHVGLFYQLGLTIGTWSIIVGFLILGVTAALTKSWPQMGAFLNMLLVGVFIDLYMLLPFLQTPDSLVGKVFMCIMGIGIGGIGMGIYISARIGAGPRDSLMLAIRDKTGWKVQNVRSALEVFVLVVGWLLGGPIFIGTFLFAFLIGPVLGWTLPLCEKITDSMFGPISPKIKPINTQSMKRGASL